nr:PAS domain-containing protein [Aquibacillus saliphilus]
MESKAFGYAIDVPPEEDWIPECAFSPEDAEDKIDSADSKHLRFGGGYLTIKEANHILNNLPLEITFIDENGIFKYFNELVESAEMMFIRTPTSIGRNVANCHPPKSLKKVMQVIRDLKSKKRSSETMWFKKKDQYIHITYKGLFTENGEYLGILEYVQDIQPFLDLPRDVKRELS